MTNFNIMKYQEKYELSEQLMKFTNKRWSVNENECQPFYTIECEALKVKIDMDTEEAVRQFCKGVMYGYLVNALEIAQADAEKQRKNAKRRRLNGSFNPWKYVGKDKNYQVLMYVHLNDGFAEATDSHMLAIERFSYDAELEGKLVDDEMKPSEREYRFPQCRKVLLNENADNVITFELEHDGEWYSAIAKQMKADKKKGIAAFLEIAGRYFKHEAAEKIGYWLQWHTPTKFLTYDCVGGIQMEDDNGNILLSMPIAARKEDIEREFDGYVIYK